MKKNKTDNKKVSIVMMSTFSGASFKAPQLMPIVHRLSEEKLLADSFGIPNATDKNEYSEDELKHLKRSHLMRFLMRMTNKILVVTKSRNSYITREKIFGFFSMLFFKTDGDIVLLKPRPSSLVRFYKKIGKITVVEASESHPQYTYDGVKRECELLEIPLVKNNYTNQRAIKDFERGISFADRIICLSDFSAGTYIKRGIDKEKIRVTGLTAGMSLVEPREESNEPIIFVSVANHGVLKGTLNLLRIWKKYGIKSRLMIIGNIHEDLAPYLDEFRNKDNIVFTGSMDRKDIEKIYKNNRCVGVLLSVSEGFSRSILECLLTATPVIVTECCTCDIVENGKNGFIVDATDSDGVFRCIKDFMSMSPEKYKAMSESAYMGAKSAEQDFLSKYIGAVLGE